MTLYRRLLSLFILVVFIIGGSIAAVNVHGAAENKISLYKSVIDLQEDGTMLVSNKVTVDFALPQEDMVKMITMKGPWYQTINGEVVEINGSAKIDQVKANVDFDTLVQSDHFFIWFNGTGKTGKQTIEYSYRCRFSIEPANGKDMLYYEPLGFDNDVPIQKADITINMLKPVNADKISILANDLSDKELTKNISKKVSGKQIRLTSTKELPKETGITIAHEFPKGHYGNSNTESSSETPATNPEETKNTPAYEIDPNENVAKKFDVVMNVNEDKSIDVTETITMDFKEAKHGIYRYIPLNGTGFYQHNGKKAEIDKSIKIDMDNIEVYGAPSYELDNDVDDQGNDIQVIQIGDPDKVLTGLQTFEISYQVRMYDDGLDEYDVFYYNALSGNFARPIEKATVQINMPKPVDKNKLDIYAGQNGINDLADQVNTTINNNQIYLESKNPFPKNAGMTVLAKLPEGYFQGAMQSDWALTVLIGIAVVSVVLCFILWLLFGRDRKMVMPVEFQPPEELTPVDISYILNKVVSSRSITGMIFSLAHKGYLNIVELPNEKILLQKLEKTPTNPTDALYLDKIFEPGEERKLPSKSFTEEMMKVEGELSDLLDKDTRIDSLSGVNEMSSYIAQKISMVFLGLPILAGSLLGLIYGRTPDFIYGSLIAIGCNIVLLIVLISFFKSAPHFRGRRFTHLVVISIILIVNCVFMFIFSCGFLVMLITIVTTIITGFLMEKMGRLTEQGNLLVGRIMGFKNFIEVAELDKLNMLVEENPSYFYHILPYAYLFGLTDKWAKNFEHIVLEPPEWFSGDSRDSFYRSAYYSTVFNRMESYVTPEFDVDTFAGSDSSSGGGSFGGGGGYSGGGAGGGGGGDW